MSVDNVIEVLLVAISLGGIYTLMAVGLTLVYGITRVFNFALGSFYLWGGYIAWTLYEGYFQLPYPLAFVLTIGIMFLFGLGYERALLYPLRRFADWGWTAIIVTLGSALFLDNLSLVVFGARGRTLPYLVQGTFTFGQFVMAKHDVATLVIVISIMVGLTLFLKNTRAGKAMRGVAQDPVGAAVVGIPADKVFGYTFALTAALAGISGPGCSWTPGSSDVSCTVAGISTGSPAQFALIVTTSEAYSGTLSNKTSVEPSVGVIDPNPANNETQVTVTIKQEIGDRQFVYLPLVMR